MLKLFTLNAALQRRWQDALEGFDVQAISQPSFTPAVSDGPTLIHLQSLTEKQIESLLEHAGESVFILLSDVPSLDEGRRFILAGVKGYANSYIHKTLMPEMLSEVEKGNIWAVPEIIQSVLQNLLQRKLPDPEKYNLADLSDRERAVFDQLMLGCSNKQIGAALAISERTVKAHVGNILRKTGAPDRVHLILNLTS